MYLQHLHAIQYVANVHGGWTPTVREGVCPSFQYQSHAVIQASLYPFCDPFLVCSSHQEKHSAGTGIGISSNLFSWSFPVILSSFKFCSFVACFVGWAVNECVALFWSPVNLYDVSIISMPSGLKLVNTKFTTIMGPAMGHGFHEPWAAYPYPLRMDQMMTLLVTSCDLFDSMRVIGDWHLWQ